MPALCNESLLLSVVPPGKPRLFPAAQWIQRGEAGIINRKVQLSNLVIFPRGSSPPRVCGEYSHAPLKAQTSKYILPVWLNINQLLFGYSIYYSVWVLLELRGARQPSLALCQWTSCWYHQPWFILFYFYSLLHSFWIAGFNWFPKEECCLFNKCRLSNLNKTLSSSLTSQSYQPLTSPRPCPPCNIFFNRL